jgi:transposase
LKKPTRKVTLSTQEGEAIIDRLLAYAPSHADCEVLIEVLRWYFWLVWIIGEAKLSINKLRSMLFGRAAKPLDLSDVALEPVCAPSPVDGEEVGTACSRDEPSGSRPGEVEVVLELAPKAKGGHRPGTGRLGAEAYMGATRVECRHDELAVGQRCPVCGQGTLYALPAGMEVRIDGNALLNAVRYELEKLRCSACGETFTAPWPQGIGDEKYSARARAVLAVSRYYLGVPGYRLQGYQAMLGVPVPDATQWDQIEVVGDCAYKVFEALEREAAQGRVIYQDDTAVRIVSLMQENRALFAQAQAHGLSAPKARTGMHTTALAVQVGEHTAILYYSSRRHAGENLQTLLDKREAGLEKPLAMSDALTSNEVADESLLIRCHCLAHGRRKFSDLAEVFPHECRVVLDVIGQVFDHDEQARQEQLSPEARLAYHQAQSQPLMDELKHWLDTQIDDHLVEPNSSLGKAIGYMRTHWQTLTRFLSIAGAPMENNLAERVLKLFIRQRKNSLFYKTPHSAYIASVLTSLIATCIYAGVDAVAYLVALQEHRREVWLNPVAWLPWAYASSRASP